MKTCTLEDCYEPHYCSGLCKKHYERLRKFGTTKSCFQRKNEKEIGKKYNKLTILKILENEHGAVVCKCDCGKIIITRLSEIINGHISCCGCQKREKVLAKIDETKLNDVSEKYKEYYKYYVSGYSFSEIGKKYGISRQRVAQILKKIYRGLDKSRVDMI